MLPLLLTDACVDVSPWLIVTVLLPDWFAVNEPPPDKAVPALTVNVPLPTLGTDGIKASTSLFV